MHDILINYWAVIVAAMARVAAAKTWFGQAFVRKAWVEAHPSLDGTKRNPRLGEAVEFVAALVIAWALAHAVGYAGAANIGDGLVVGFLAWFVFMFVGQTTGLIWDMRQPRYFLIAQVYQLVSFLVMGAILATWT